MLTTIRNETPKRLKLVGMEERELELAPLEQRQFELEDLSHHDLSNAMRLGLVSRPREPPREILESLWSKIGVIGFALFVACGVFAGNPPSKWMFSPTAWKVTIWSAGALALFLVGAIVLINQQKKGRLVSRFLLQIITLAVILAIGVGVPLAALRFFNRNEPFLGNLPRLLQVSFIAIASLLPVLLYFLFDRYRLDTLRARLYRDLFRLDRRLKKCGDINAKYGAQILETYGPEEEGSGRLARGTRWPVLVCAFAITVGWVAVSSPAGSIFPQPRALSFGFLGAYFFGLQLITRRYARGDLKPKVYSYITVRIVAVVILSWLIEAVFPADSSSKLVLAFLIGILPDEFFTLVREFFRGRIPDRAIPQSEQHPLTRLEGIDLYERARLEQEGVVNIEALAHHEFVDLIIETRIPVPRLVDWMDQAILYLHTVEDPEANQTNGATNSTVRQKLREYGIRTATDLLISWQAAEDRAELDGFKNLLGDDKKPSRLEVIRDSITDDEWLERIKDWRKDLEPEIETVAATPTSFEGWFNWASKLESEQRFEAAIQAYDEALRICDDKSASRAHVRLADLRASVPIESLRDRELYIKHAQRAADWSYGNFDVLSELAAIYQENGDLKEARKMYTDARETLKGIDTDWAKEKRKSVETKIKQLDDQSELSGESAAQ